MPSFVAFGELSSPWVPSENRAKSGPKGGERASKDKQLARVYEPENRLGCAQFAHLTRNSRRSNFLSRLDAAKEQAIVVVSWLDVALDATLFGFHEADASMR